MTNRTKVRHVISEWGQPNIMSLQYNLLTEKCWNWTDQQMPVRLARLMRTAGQGISLTARLYILKFFNFSYYEIPVLV